MLSIVLCTFLSAQTAPGIYKVTFTDKNNTPFSFTQPLDFLSQRALDRRNAQGIALDSLDLPVDPTYVTTLSNALHMEVVHTSRWFNAVTFKSVDTLGLDTIEALPFVLSLRSTRSRANIERIPKFATTKQADLGQHYSGLYGGAERQVTMINAHLLHEKGARGEGMLIGVLDSGFEQVDSLAAFEELRSGNHIVFTHDVAENEADVYDDHWHGMSVLSCLAGNLPGDIVGTATNADYALIRTEFVDSEYIWEEDNWAVGAELCDSLGCDILNTSLGYTTFEDSTQNHSYGDLDGQSTVISRAAAIASSKGMIPVTSAGNSGTSSWYHIGAPADAPNTLAVGAVHGNGVPADFSSHGYSADGRVKPDISVRGQSAWGIVPWGYVTGSINGTSFSSPIAAGAVACLWQRHPERTNTEIMEAVRQSAHRFNDPNADLGFGIPDFEIADRILNGEEPMRTEDVIFNVYPSMFTDHFFVELFSLEGGEMSIDLFDIQGKQVLGKKAMLDAGHITKLRVNAEELNNDRPGAYSLRVQQGDIILNQLLIRE